MATLKVERWYDYEITVHLVWRIKTAIEMMNTMIKLDIQQETDTEWSKFYSSLFDYLKSNNYYISIIPGNFKGNTDVIMELVITLIPNKENKPTIPINDEKIIGTVFNDLFTYMGFIGWNKPRVDCYSNSDRNEINSLSIFK